MKFASRQDAGIQLGIRLRERGFQAELVVGLPRGGVVVAAEVARILDCPLEALAVRKLGHPMHREFAVGALAEAGVVLLDEQSLGQGPFIREQLESVIKEEKDRLRSYEEQFHPNERRIPGRRVVIVDDGVATGSTTEAAVRSARKQGATGVVVAVPVCSTEAARRLHRVADELVCLLIDPDFDAVGRYYEEFLQCTDEEVVALLRAGGGQRGTGL